MNLSAGFAAAGRGLELMANNAARREELDWQAAREENLQRLRHTQNLELEGVRAKNDADAAEKQRTFVAGENKANREADDARQNRADARADARQRRADSKADNRELSELRRHRTTTLQAFRAQYAKSLTDYNNAKASGMADEDALADMEANIRYIAREMQDFDAQSKDELAAAGDPWAKKQLLTDEDIEKMAGDGGQVPSAAQGAGAAQPRPSGAPARPKPKPMVPQAMRDTQNPRPNPLASGDAAAVANWAAGVDQQATQQRTLQQQEEDRRRTSYYTRPTREQLATASHSTGPRLIP